MRVPLRAAMGSAQKFGDRHVAVHVDRDRLEAATPAGRYRLPVAEVRPATAGDLPALLSMARTFYDEDGFATTDAQLRSNFGVLSSLLDYYRSRGFLDEGRRLLMQGLSVGGRQVQTLPS
jgi:hypothetical protein